MLRKYWVCIPLSTFCLHTLYSHSPPHFVYMCSSLISRIIQRPWSSALLQSTGLEWSRRKKYSLSLSLFIYFFFFLCPHYFWKPTFSGVRLNILPTLFRLLPCWRNGKRPHTNKRWACSTRALLIRYPSLLCSFSPLLFSILLLLSSYSPFLYTTLAFLYSPLLFVLSPSFPPLSPLLSLSSLLFIIF